MAVRPSIARVAAERWTTLRRALADRDLARLLVAAASWYATDVTSLLVVSVMAFTVTNGRIVRIDALVDPERLARLR